MGCCRSGTKICIIYRFQQPCTDGLLPSLRSDLQITNGADLWPGRLREEKGFTVETRCDEDQPSGRSGCGAGAIGVEPEDSITGLARAVVVPMLVLTRARALCQ